MPANDLNRHNINDNGEQVDPEGFENAQRDRSPVVVRNILSANPRQSATTVINDLDEEVIRRRGKRERKTHIITRSMTPIILATRKSPIKRQREGSVTIEMIRIFELSKSPCKSPSKKVRSSPPPSPGMMTRKRLNMSCDSGIATPSTSSISSPSANGSRSSVNKKTPVNNVLNRTRRSIPSRARRNLRRLS